MIVQICVGSSCFIKGSQDIIEMLTKDIEENSLDREVTLAGCFCTGKCNRVGVTVIVDDETFEGITKENYKEFFEKNILDKLKK